MSAIPTTEDAGVVGDLADALQRIGYTPAKLAAALALVAARETVIKCAECNETLRQDHRQDEDDGTVTVFVDMCNCGKGN